jgi:hypothetical protein
MVRVLVATATAWITVGFLAAAALVCTGALARAHGRRSERRKAATLTRRLTDRGPGPAGPHHAALARSASGVRGSPETELRHTLDHLLEERDALLEEFQQVQTQIHATKRQVERRRRVVPMSDGDANMADVIVLRAPTVHEERSEHGRSS